MTTLAKLRAWTRRYSIALHMSERCNALKLSALTEQDATEVERLYHHWQDRAAHWQRRCTQIAIEHWTTPL